MTSLVWLAAAATACLMAGVALGVHLERQEAAGGHTEALAASEVARRGLLAHNAWLRDEVRHLVDLRQLSAHDWPDDAIERLAADVARWDIGLYDQDACTCILVPSLDDMSRPRSEWPRVPGADGCPRHSPR